MPSDAEGTGTPHECEICGDQLLGFTQEDYRDHLVEAGERHAKILAKQARERAEENVFDDE